MAHSRALWISGPCSGVPLHPGFAHAEWQIHIYCCFLHRLAQTAERVVRAQTQPIILRGVFDIDTHKVPKGLHAWKCTFKLCEVLLTSTRAKCREGCPCPNATYHFTKCF